MKKLLEIFWGVLCWINAVACYASDKFDILPDLPEPLVGTAAQASSVTTTESTGILSAQSVGHEPNLLSIIFSLIFVILLIYATGIIYTKLNKMGISTFKKQVGDNHSQVSVVSTTPLGNNKTLHVVELDGKRMLIGASASSIHLIKDLGTVNEGEICEFSKIEIPDIRIPKIEIPKIEIPNLGFTKVTKKSTDNSHNNDEKVQNQPADDAFQISDIYEESDNTDGIIDNLFHDNMQINKDKNTEAAQEHKVDPEEFVLYKKYL